MKIVSWDIGIKHLAYCIMDYEKENNKWNIYHWGNINLLEEDMLSCSGVFKKTKLKCDKPARYQFMVNGKTIGLCGLHKRQHKDIAQDHNYTQFQSAKSLTEVLPCQFYQKVKKSACNKKSMWYTEVDGKKCGYCTSHKKSYEKKEKKEVSLKPFKKPTCKSVSVHEIKIRLVRALDKIPALLEVDKVIIENQPTKNTTMKLIADDLYTWFLIKGIVDKGTINEIKFYSASNKLKVDKDNTAKVLSKAENKEEQYTLTKKLGVQYSKQLLANDEKNLKIIEDYEKNDKADDICDAFLQGLTYLVELNNTSLLSS